MAIAIATMACRAERSPDSATVTSCEGAVGADLQTDNPVRGVGNGGQHDHRYLGRRANVLALLQPAFSGRAGVYPALASRFDFWPVTTGEGRAAAIGLAFDPNNRPSAPATSIASRPEPHAFPHRRLVSRRRHISHKPSALIGSE